MPTDMTTILKLLSDVTRLRIIAVLSGNELTVKELTEILQIGQSTLSTQLGQLKDGHLVSARKEGQYVYYRVPKPDDEYFLARILDSVLEESTKTDWFERDKRKLQEILRKRREASLSYFSTQKAQNQTSPGQTWESLALGLAQLIRGQRIIDLGCGIGKLSAMLSSSGNIVLGVDASEEQISSARKLHQRNIGQHLDFLVAPMEATGLELESFDVAIISQALHHAAEPAQAIKEAARLIQRGGRILILDLVRHSQDWIQERFADFWLGFESEDLKGWLTNAGFGNVECLISGPDVNYPQIETLIISAERL